MRLSPITAALVLPFIVGAIAGPLVVRGDRHDNHDDHNNDGLPRICTDLQTKDGGCIRYVQGFDVTGVLTEIDLTFPEVQTKCDCIQECLNRPTLCANYVFKFASAASVMSGYRNCTLYSDFNLPSDVIVNVDLVDSVNIDAATVIALGNNPHKGGPVPQAFKDSSLSSVPDDDAFSGPVWQLANGDVLC